MSETFKLLGLLYALYAAFEGRVYAKSGFWGKVISRDESPCYFWTIIAIYACLGFALVTAF